MWICSTHTHTSMYIYIYRCVCVCVCLDMNTKVSELKLKCSVWGSGLWISRAGHGGRKGGGFSSCLKQTQLGWVDMGWVANLCLICKADISYSRRLFKISKGCQVAPADWLRGCVTNSFCKASFESIDLMCDSFWIQFQFQSFSGLNPVHHG